MGRIFIFLLGVACGVAACFAVRATMIARMMAEAGITQVALPFAPRVGSADSIDRGPPLASMIDVKVESAVEANAAFLPEAQVLVTNRSDDYVTVYVTCAFLDKGGAATSNGTGIVSNIPPGGSARDNVTSSAQYSRPQNVECRAASARIAG